MSETMDLPVAEALRRILDSVRPLAVERVALPQSLGRILAQDVSAQNSLPPFDNSAMDGYALRAQDIVGAARDKGVTLTVVGDIAAGSWPQLRLQLGEAARIMTGAPIPAGADAVIPVEDTNEGWQKEQRPLPPTIDIYRSVNSGDYIRREGGDVGVGELVLHSGHRIRPQEISVLASLGVAQVAVYRQARVGILATGDELVAVDVALEPGKIRNSNGYAQEAQVREVGAIPVSLGVALDSEADVRAKLQAGLKKGVDLFISSAGVSVGAYDVVKSVLQQDGDVGFWRVRMRPGKPLAFGRYAGVPYLGLPGNPVSSMVSFERFARPAILKMMGHRELERRTLLATVADRFSSDGRESYIRVVVQQRQGELVAMTTGAQGSHMITSLVKANGLLVVPEGMTEVESGSRLPVLLFD